MSSTSVVHAQTGSIDSDSLSGSTSGSLGSLSGSGGNDTSAKPGDSGTVDTASSNVDFIREQMDKLGPIHDTEIVPKAGTVRLTEYPKDVQWESNRITVTLNPGQTAPEVGGFLQADGRGGTDFPIIVRVVSLSKDPSGFDIVHLEPATLAEGFDKFVYDSRSDFDLSAVSEVKDGAAVTGEKKTIASPKKLPVKCKDGLGSSVAPKLSLKDFQHNISYVHGLKEDNDGGVFNYSLVGVYFAGEVELESETAISGEYKCKISFDTVPVSAGPFSAKAGLSFDFGIKVSLRAKGLQSYRFKAARVSKVGIVDRGFFNKSPHSVLRVQHFEIEPTSSDETSSEAEIFFGIGISAGVYAGNPLVVAVGVDVTFSAEASLRVSLKTTTEVKTTTLLKREVCLKLSVDLVFKIAVAANFIVLGAEIPASFPYSLVDKEACKTVSSTELPDPDESKTVLKASSGGETTDSADGVSKDTMFVIDTTGSMHYFIAKALAKARELSEKLLSGEGSRVGLVEYRDHGDDFVARTVVGLTDNYDDFLQGLVRLKVDGGGDTPEAVYSGIVEAMNASWSPRSTRSIIVIGDAPAYDPEPVTGYTSKDIQRLLNGISADSEVHPLGEKSPTRYTTVADKTGLEVSLYGLSGAKLLETQLNELAEASDGIVYTLGGEVNSIGEAIDRAVEDVNNKPVAVISAPHAVVQGMSYEVDCSASTAPRGMSQLGVDLDEDGIIDAECADGKVTITAPSEQGQQKLTMIAIDKSDKRAEVSVAVTIINSPSKEIQSPSSLGSIFGSLSGA